MTRALLLSLLAFAIAPGSQTTVNPRRTVQALADAGKYDEALVDLDLVEDSLLVLGKRHPLPLQRPVPLVGRAIFAQPGTLNNALAGRPVPCRGRPPLLVAPALDGQTVGVEFLTEPNRRCSQVRAATPAGAAWRVFPLFGGREARFMFPPSGVLVSGSMSARAARSRR